MVPTERQVGSHPRPRSGTSKHDGPKDSTVEQLMDRNDVANLLAVHVNTLDSIRQRDDAFPDPIRLGDRVLRWDPADIRGWLDRKKGRPARTVRKGGHRKSPAEHLG